MMLCLLGRRSSRIPSITRILHLLVRWRRRRRGSVRPARGLRLDGGLHGGGLVRLLDVDLGVLLELLAAVGGDRGGNGRPPGLEIGDEGLAEGYGEENAGLVSAEHTVRHDSDNKDGVRRAVGRGK